MTLDYSYVTFLESSDRRVREEAFKAMYETFSSFKNTLAAPILRIEVSIIPDGANDVIYELVILYNDNGTPIKDVISLPMPRSRDYLSDNLAKELINNRNEKISYLIYSV